MQDSFDEELELELDDDRLDALAGDERRRSPPAANPGQFGRCQMQTETSVTHSLAVEGASSPSSSAAPIPGLVWAFRIHADGSPEALAADQPIPFAHDGLLWLHLNLADARTLQWLAKSDLDLPAPARALLLS